MEKGLIVSIQGYSIQTTVELAGNAIRAGAIAIRTDKNMKSEVPTIGLRKIKVRSREEESYITVDVEAVKDVARWADYIAFDARSFNTNMKSIVEYCKQNGLKLIADIACMDDYKNIIDAGFEFEYVTTALSVFDRHEPDLKLVADLHKTGCKRIIAEGNFTACWQVAEAYKNGAVNVCVGTAISDIYKNTRRFAIK
jgi:putative N-acetylmannosamine-6-phosphate epimerase